MSNLTQTIHTEEELLKELLDYTELRLNILGNTDDPDEAVKAIHALIFSERGQNYNLAQSQALGMALAFSEVRHILQRKREAPKTTKQLNN